MGAKSFSAILLTLVLFASLAQSAFGKEGAYLVILKDGTDSGIVAKYGEIVYKFKTINAVTAKLSKEAAEQLIQEPGIESLEEGKPFQIGPAAIRQKEAGSEITFPSRQSNATDYGPGSQWNLTQQGINAEAAWSDFNATGKGVKIAIIDSGVDYDVINNLSRSKYLGGWDFCGFFMEWQCGEFEWCAECIMQDGNPMDEYGHGTEMASAMLGGEDISGVAPETQYYAVKIADYAGRSHPFALWAALDWALSKDVDIIYIGGDYSSVGLNIALGRYYDNGLLVVVPTYEKIKYDSSSEAFMRHVLLEVGAHNKDLPQDINEETGSYAEVLAPGEEVPVRWLGDYQPMAADSISVAAAQAAGALALMIDYNRTHALNYSNFVLRADLNQSAINLWPLDPKAGGGKLDVNAALAWMANNWFLEYDVNYLDPDSRNRGGTPSYYKGQEIQYSITIKNNSDKTANPKTIYDLNVVSRQTIAGAREFFTVATLQPGEEKTIGPYPVGIPVETITGGYNTQIILKKEKTIINKNFPFDEYTDIAILKSDQKAGQFYVTDKPVEPQRFCTDSDGGVDPFVFGTCTDSRGATVSDKSIQSNGKSYVMEAFCLTPEMREHCALKNGEKYCDNLPNDCYALPLLPLSALAWTYFDRNDEAYVCPNGSYKGVCSPMPGCSAGWKCRSTQYRAFQNEKCGWTPVEYCEHDCLDGECVAESTASGESNATVDDTALDTNSTEQPVQQLNAPELEIEPEPQPDPVPEQPDTPLAQGNVSGGSGGYAGVTTRIVSNTEPSNESKVEASAVNEEKGQTEDNTTAITMEEPLQETQTSPKQETAQPTVLLAENNENPAGFVVLAQGALNAIIVIVGGAIAICGKLFFR